MTDVAEIARTPHPGATTMTMTPERLAELDAVMAKATAGPWSVAQHCLAGGEKPVDTVKIVPIQARPLGSLVRADGEAIVALHNAYADLRAHIDAQAATIARLRGALEPFAKEAACWDEEQNDGFSFPDHEPLEMESQLQVKHLRCARAALTGAA